MNLESSQYSCTWPSTTTDANAEFSLTIPKLQHAYNLNVAFKEPTFVDSIKTTIIGGAVESNLGNIETYKTTLQGECTINGFVSDAENNENLPGISIKAYRGSNSLTDMTTSLTR